ncbi:MAG: c-type cytochrome [Gemmatimonadaceae bacterium]
MIHSYCGIIRRRNAGALLIGACVALAATACGDSQLDRGAGAGSATVPAEAVPAGVTDTSGLPAEGELSRVAIGDIAGANDNTLETTVKSPYAGNAAAIAEGHELFEKMNCAACHGYDMKGGMGPNLTDTYWRYGGAPADIYKSIFEGRPQGMPSWGRALTPTLIWKVVAYIESKGGAVAAVAADRARQGDESESDTTSGSTLKGRNSAP